MGTYVTCVKSIKWHIFQLQQGKHGILKWFSEALVDRRLKSVFFAQIHGGHAGLLAQVPQAPPHPQQQQQQPPQQPQQQQQDVISLQYMELEEFLLENAVTVVQQQQQHDDKGNCRRTFNTMEIMLHVRS